MYIINSTTQLTPHVVPIEGWCPAHITVVVRPTLTFPPPTLHVQPALQLSHDGVNWTTEPATFDR